MSIKKENLFIYRKLKENKDMKIISFHMPGHKYGSIFDELGYSNIMREIYSLDTTEIIGTDNLHNPKEIIRDTQENIKRIIYPEVNCEVKILVNGSSCGIEAAIMSSLQEGDKIILNRGCHQSAYNGILLSKSEPIYVREIIDERDNIFKGASSYEYIRAIEENPNAKVVLITRPTYHGMCFEIEDIIQRAHEKNMIVVVDEAHGAHFGLNERFPKSAIYYGADIVIQSSHKTLPSFTQTSIMIVNKNNKNIDISKLNQMLTIMQTSSPSYIMMMSVEICYDIYEKYGRVKMLKLLDEINRFKKSLTGYRVYETSDPTKIFINTIENGINGYDFAKVLRYRYNIQVELSNYSGVLLLCTIANKPSDFKEMKKALFEIKNKKLFGLNLDFFDDPCDLSRKSKNDDIKKITTSKSINLSIPYDIPKIKYNPYTALNMETEYIPIIDSIGRVSADFVTPYPPGVCLIGPGEVISSEVVDYLKRAKLEGIDINGIDRFEEDLIRVCIHP